MNILGGESSTCASYLIDVYMEGGDEQVRIVEEGFVSEEGTCTDDYNRFAVLAAVDRDRLPAIEDLPADGGIRAWNGELVIDAGVNAFEDAST